MHRFFFLRRRGVVRAVFVLALAGIALAGCDRLKNYSDLEYVQRAKKFQEEGKQQVAVIDLKNALQKNPDNSEARLMLGEIYVAQGNGKEAEKELKAAQKLGVSEETLKVPLGRAYLLQRLYAKVLAEIRPGANSSQSNTARILEIEGQAQLGLGQAEKGCALFGQALENDPAYVQAHWGLARCAASRGKYDEARARLDEALKLEEKSSDTWVQLGDLERTLGRLAEAETAYGNALKYKPSNLWAFFGRAATRIQGKKLAEAKQDITKASSIVKDHPMGAHLRGVVQYHEGKYPEAKTSFELVLKYFPDYYPSVLWLGYANYAQQNYEQAAKHFARVAQEFPHSVQINALLALTQVKMGSREEAEEKLKLLSKVNIDDPLSLSLVGEAYVLAGEAGTAAQYLQRVVASRPEVADFHLNLAVALLQNSETTKAVEELEKAVQLQPTLLQAGELLIRTLLKDKQFDKAARAIDQFQASHPASPVPHNYRGAMLALQDKMDAAAGEFIEAMKVQPGNPEAGHRLAMIALRRGDLEQARAYYQKILEFNKDHLMTLLALYSVETKAGRVERAQEVLQTAVAKHPDAPAPAALLGGALLVAGNPIKALDVTREAAAVKPDNLPLLEIRGAAYLAAGDFGNALACYKRMTQLQPKSADASYYLATVHAALKDAAAYRKTLRQALQQKPDHLRAKMALARLELGEGKSDAALALSRELQKEHPQALDGVLLEAEIAMSRGRARDAIAVLEQFQQKNPAALPPRYFLAQKYLQAGEGQKALKLAEEAMAAFPDHPQAFDLLGQTQAAMGDKQGALQTYRQLARLKPGLPLAWLRLAAAQKTLDDRNAAAESLKQALKLKPDYLEAQLALARLEIVAARYDAALALAQQVQKQRPASAVGFMLEGDALLAQKKYSDAARVFETAYGVEKNGEVAMRLYAALANAGNVREADEKILRWLKEKPDDMLVRMYLGEAYMLRGKNKSAIEQYQQVAVRDPQNALVLNNLAGLYQKERDPRALETAEKAYRIRPDNALTSDTLGWLLIEQGKTARGLELLQKAAQLAPGLAEVRYHYAAALAKSGNREKARGELQRLLAAEKNFPQYEEAKALLKSL